MKKSLLEQLPSIVANGKRKAEQIFLSKRWGTKTSIRLYL